MSDRGAASGQPLSTVPPGERVNRLDVTSMTVEVAVRFEAAVEAVWDLLTHVERMAGLGPEHFRAHWLTPAPAVGARFQGWNRMGDQEWDVICVVTECQPPAFIEWNVGEGPLPSSTWSYRLTGEPDGSTLVVQRFRHGPGASGVTAAIERYPERAGQIVTGRSRTLRTNMISTLEAAARLIGSTDVDAVDARGALESERLLAEERVRTMTAEIAGLAGDADDANGDDEHDPEGSTVAYERARVAALLAEAESNLRDLDRALERLSAGTYSVCEGCGGTIPGERLEALPAARHCFACASRASGPVTDPIRSRGLDP